MRFRPVVHVEQTGPHVIHPGDVVADYALTAFNSAAVIDESTLVCVCVFGCQEHFADRRPGCRSVQHGQFNHL